MTQFPSPGPEAQDQPSPASSGTSPADADHEGGTAAPDSASVAGIDDEQLPEDLQPTEDNPLAQPLDPDDEATKDREELAMDATQEDLGNDDGASQAPDQQGDDVTGGGAGQSGDDSQS